MAKPGERKRVELRDELARKHQIKAEYNDGLPTRCRFSKSRKEPPRSVGRSYVAETVWLSNNFLVSLEGLKTFLETRIYKPLNVTWLDLSCNKIATLEADLVDFSRLGILYLHCNCLESLEEVRRLSKLRSLLVLTLYGNPLEAQLDYRLKVLANIPTLRRLDFSPVTKKERYLAQMYEPKRKIESGDTGKAAQWEEEDKETVLETSGGSTEYQGEEVSEEGEEETVSLSEKSQSSEEDMVEGEMDQTKKGQELPGQIWSWSDGEKEAIERVYSELKERESKYVFNYFQT